MGWGGGQGGWQCSGQPQSSMPTTMWYWLLSSTMGGCLGLHVGSLLPTRRRMHATIGASTNGIELLDPCKRGGLEPSFQRWVSCFSCASLFAPGLLEVVSTPGEYIFACHSLRPDCQNWLHPPQTHFCASLFMPKRWQVVPAPAPREHIFVHCFLHSDGWKSSHPPTRPLLTNGRGGSNERGTHPLFG